MQSLRRLFFPKAAVNLLGHRIIELLGAIILTLSGRKYRSVSQATSKQEVLPVLNIDTF